MISVSAEGQRTIGRFAEAVGGNGPFVEIALRAWDSSGRGVGDNGWVFRPVDRVDVKIDSAWRQRGLDQGKLGPALDLALRSYAERFQPRIRPAGRREEMEFRIQRGVLLDHSVAAFRSAHDLHEDLGATLESALIEISREYSQSPWEGKLESFSAEVNSDLYDQVRDVLGGRKLDFDTIVATKLAELVKRRFA